jgi:hypothetical protein
MANCQEVKLHLYNEILTLDDEPSDTLMPTVLMTAFVLDITLYFGKY